MPLSVGDLRIQLVTKQAIISSGGLSLRLAEAGSEAKLGITAEPVST